MKEVIHRGQLQSDGASEGSELPVHSFKFLGVIAPRGKCIMYEQGAKEVALSVVSGINSSVFAYGQTSSGKTYTMSGITKYTMQIYIDYIERHVEREIFLEFSAMDIYNESVRDLLSIDSSPLRLLDDPQLKDRLGRLPSTKQALDLIKLSDCVLYNEYVYKRANTNNSLKRHRELHYLPTIHKISLRREQILINNTLI